MAKKEAQRVPRVRYADVNVYVEEAKYIKNHRPAIVVVWKRGKKAVMRIIPSEKWEGEMERIEESLSGLFSHETLHIWLGRVFGEEAMKKLDKLPKPANSEDYSAGVFGWGLEGDKVTST